MKKRIVFLIMSIVMGALLWAGCAPEKNATTATEKPAVTISEPMPPQTLMPTEEATSTATAAPSAEPTATATGAAEPEPTPASTGSPVAVPSPTPAPDGVVKPTPRPTVQAAAQLTALETAGKGTHSYSFTAEYFSGAQGSPSGTADITLTFSGNSVTTSGAGNATFYKVAENTYETIDDSGDVVTITLTSNGFTLVSWGGRFVYTRTD